MPENGKSTNTNLATVTEPPKTIEVPEWCHLGIMIVRRDSLPSNHPESYYRYIKEKLKLNPEDYGILYNPYCTSCGEKLFRGMNFCPQCGQEIPQCRQ